jgi:hypothetical protein
MLQKAQLRIQEMAFMIVAVVLFFVLVGLFILSIAYTGLSEEATRIAEDRTLSSIIVLADSPELNCIRKTNCVDGDKFINLIGKNAYLNFWPYSSLRLIKFSGFGKEKDEMLKCTKENYPDCDLIEVFDKGVSNERTVGSFVAFCRKDNKNDAVYDKCEIAKLIAGTKLKK